MEILSQVEQAGTTQAPGGWPSNDNRQAPLSMGRSHLPGDAVARIFRPGRSVMTSGTARPKAWRLAFERRSAPFVEPLMGWTGGDDTLTQVALEFPTLKAAVNYAQRQGLNYVVQASAGGTAKRRKRRGKGSTHAFSDATLERLGLAGLQDSYGRALDDAANRNDPAGSENWASPMDVARDRALPIEAKRSILMNWAWTEYLIDQATNEGMPENSRPSRLDEVEQALLTLEREVAGRPEEASKGQEAA